MDFYRITLFGHRDFGAHKMVEEELPNIFRDLLSNRECLEIYIGRHGEFDRFAASVIRRIQKALGEERVSLTLVLPYPFRDMEYYERYYDHVIIPSSKRTHPKRAIAEKNRWMVEECDLFIGYVERTSGGAYTALQYAKKCGKAIINLAEKERSDDP